MSENTLFNECLACKMKFETRQQLENHVRKVKSKLKCKSSV